MRFAAVTLGVGFVGTILASYLQSPSVASAESLVARMSPPAHLIAAETAVPAAPAAMRLIDMRNGANCKVPSPADGDGALQPLPIGGECSASPELSRVAYWQTREDGSLVMADNGGRTVLEFIPGDGVLYESIYPTNALITIVAARG
ncbi:hypothetical protein [Aureimonas jatrophae]|jgi:hypothetical protein|uniref:Alkaline proteinase inhibitor/ Outer membrane lipoprotein Omp19 domain-containing protein n=1 Tax=Aureimonas jatrophae TaxID=1166073 RepID=A0A1H0J735_9HYPH|nr:hypothetical protein [Aureimonas jatrophae]MBB3951577.1 hypothetical protein [Aureimonas jatrophae]SDO39151.1 hypothetical protein SAMN05192530_10617 [Aureimonas jatrophae]